MELKINTRKANYEDDFAILLVNDKQIVRCHAEEIGEYMDDTFWEDTDFLNKYDIGEGRRFESCHEFTAYIYEHCWNDEQQIYEYDTVKIIILDI